MITDGAVLFYDGSCGLCAASVRFVLRHEGPGRRLLRFAPLAGPSASVLLARHAYLAGIDSIVLVTPAPDGGENVQVRSDAAIEIARYLGGGWRIVALVASVFPRPIRDAIYDLIARHRHRLLPSAEVCELPSNEDSARFIP